MPLAESRRQQKALKTISIIAYIAFFTNSFLKPDRFCRIPMILWGLYAGLYLHKPIVWARLRSGVPFFGASHPFRRPFLRSISGVRTGLHTKIRVLFLLFCAQRLLFSRSHAILLAKLHHSNQCYGLAFVHFCRCILLPLTGTVTSRRKDSTARLSRMQPFTPHGDSNLEVCPTETIRSGMQPFTPHGDSNLAITMIVCGFQRMQPFTPHGDSNHKDHGYIHIHDLMQPYTPHGDSNH